MAALPYLLLDTDGTEIGAKVEFNGIVLSDRLCSPPIRTAHRLNGWAIDGTNSMRVWLWRPPGAGGGGAADKAHFKLRLRRAQPGSDGSADVTLDEFEWSPAASAPAGPAPTLVHAQEVTLSAPAIWQWTYASPVTSIQAAEMNGIAALLRQLHDALSRKAIGEVISLQQVQLAENAVSIGDDPQALAGRYRDFLQEQTSQADWRLEPFDAGALTATTMAGGRVQRISGPNGAPPIMATGGQGVSFSIMPYVSKLAGRWTIVR